MEGFMMIPNKIVWNYEDKTKTYFYEYGDKVLHIFSYLQRMTNNFNETYFTLEDMILNCGLGVDIHEGKSVDQFKDILLDLQKKEIITTDMDFVKVKKNTLIKCNFYMPIEKDDEDENVFFFDVTYNSYLKIMNYEGNLSKLTLLKAYYYISSRIKRRRSLIDGDGCIYDPSGKKYSNDIRCVGGKAECFYDSYAVICDDLKIKSENTWNTYIKELNNMGLLFYANIGTVKKGSSSHDANNVYCLNEAELSDALAQSRLYYIDEGYCLVNKKTSKEVRVINGTKGKIAQSKNSGQDTTKLEKKLIKLEKEKTKLIPTRVKSPLIEEIDSLEGNIGWGTSEAI